MAEQIKYLVYITLAALFIVGILSRILAPVSNLGRWGWSSIFAPVFKALWWLVSFLYYFIKGLLNKGEQKANVADDHNHNN